MTRVDLSWYRDLDPEEFSRQALENLRNNLEFLFYTSDLSLGKFAEALDIHSIRLKNFLYRQRGLSLSQFLKISKAVGLASDILILPPDDFANLLGPNYQYWSIAFKSR